jgi:hypothetical protein
MRLSPRYGDEGGSGAVIPTSGAYTARRLLVWWSPLGSSSLDAGNETDALTASALGVGLTGDTLRVGRRWDRSGEPGGAADRPLQS